MIARSTAVSVALVIVGLAGIQAQSGIGTPADTVRYVGPWNWGNKFYDQEFGDTYPFENNCDKPVVVTFNTTAVPFLSIKPSDWNAKPGTTEVPVKLTTPSWPDIPQCTDLQGVLIVTSTGYETDDGVCHPSQRSYTVTAHVHWWDRPGPPPKLKVGGPDACTVWWNTGQRPANARGLSEASCLDTFHKLAAAYRDWIAAASSEQPDVDWSWLPSAAQVLSMSIAEMLAMKDRANQLLGISPADH